MRRPVYALLIAIILCLTMVRGPASSAFGNDRPPNVIVILSDDQGWGDLSINGNRNLETPAIDSLARDGARFDRFYVCPVCSPTRAEFLTGRYHPRTGVFSTSAGGERLDLDETTIADVFRAAGYATAAFGKWHNGMQYPYHPNGRGFDEYYGFCSGHWGHYYSPMLEHNGQIVRGSGFVIDDFTDHAMEFMEDHQEQPFFIYLPYNTPHSPMQVPDRWWNRMESKELTMRHRQPERENDLHLRAALAMCENIDWNVGRLLTKLDELDLQDDTIVLYFCDNGPNGFRWNGGMKGRKGSTDEGGVRSPLHIRYPSKIKPGTEIDELGAAIDLLPTLSDLAGIPAETLKPLDGVSLAGLLTGEKETLEDRMIFSHWRDRVSVRTHRYRLDHQGMLFDMIEDPGQTRDISEENRNVMISLGSAAEDFRRDVLSELSTDNSDRPFIVGHPDYEWTQIPARDATVTGDIQRSNRFPNCSYFSNWTSVEESIQWDVEIPQEGEFEVQVYYACPEKDLGSVFELSFGDDTIQGQVVTANDPPLVGAEQDRSPRTESLVKDFKPMTLGTIRLSAGRGTLALNALEIPGDQVMEFRLLMLRRVGD